MKHLGLRLSKTLQGKDAAALQRLHAGITGSGHASSRTWEQSQQMAASHFGWQQAPAEGLRLYSPHWLPYVVTVAHHQDPIYSILHSCKHHTTSHCSPLGQSSFHQASFSSWLSYLLIFSCFCRWKEI